MHPSILWLETFQFLPLCRIPQADSSIVVAASSNPGTVRAVSHRIDPTLMPGEVKHLATRDRIPHSGNVIRVLSTGYQLLAVRRPCSGVDDVPVSTQIIEWLSRCRVPNTHLIPIGGIQPLPIAAESDIARLAAVSLNI